MNYKLVSIAIVLLLAGCASFPEGIPTATIRFTADAPVIIKSMCPGDTFIKPGLIRNPYLSETSPVKMYGTRNDKNNEVVERLIPAERTLLFRVRWGHAGMSGSQMTLTQCDTLFSLAPRPQEQYQADYALGANSCSLKLYKLSEKSGVIQKTEIPVRLHAASESTDNICRRNI